MIWMRLFYWLKSLSLRLNNPGEIKEIIEVDLPRHRNTELILALLKQLRARSRFLRVRHTRRTCSPALEDF